MLSWFKSPNQKYIDWKKKFPLTSELHLLDYNRHQFRKSTNVIHLERKDYTTQIIDIIPQKKEIVFEGDQANFLLQPLEWDNEVRQIIEDHLQPKIKEFTDFIKLNPPASGNLQNEFKGHEWLKATLIVLNNALASLTREQTLQTTIFIGKQNDRLEIRVIIFNLDLCFAYDSKMQALIVTCFNKKDSVDFDYTKCDLEAVFQANAYSVIDEAIQLLQTISLRILKEI